MPKASPHPQKSGTRAPTFADPMRPNRLEILTHIAHRNQDGIAVRFSLAELISEAQSAEAGGQIEWRSDPETGQGRWITPLGLDVLAKAASDG